MIAAGATQMNLICGVMRNHTTVLIARRTSRVLHEVLAADLLEMEPEDSPDVLEFIHRFNPTRGLDESLDVRRVIQRRPRHLQYLASLLPDDVDRQRFASRLEGHGRGCTEYSGHLRLFAYSGGVPSSRSS